MFYRRRKECSCGVFSAGLRSSEQTPLRGVIVPCICPPVNTANVPSILGGISPEKISHALFLQLLRNISRSHTTVKRFDPGCARAVLLQLRVSPIPRDYAAMPFIISALVLLNEPLYKPQKLELAWVGNGLRFGFLLLWKQAGL